MPHSRSLSEQSCLLSNIDFRHEERDKSWHAHPSQHDVHDHHDPESALPLLPTPKETESVSWTELPNKSQLLILSLCHFSDSLSNLFLLPYLFHLVRSAVSPSNTPSLAAGNDDIVTYYTSIPTTALVSTYSGILVACFPHAISAVASLAFGLSQPFWALFGNEGILRSMAGKFADKAHQVLSMVSNLGMVAGLAMGGLLAEPVKAFPGLFGTEGTFNWTGSEEGVRWMVHYPFALPSVVNAMLIGVVAAITTGWLRAMMPEQDQAEDGTDNTSTLLSFHRTGKPTPISSILSTLTTRTLPPLISSFLLTLHTSAFTSILLLHISTPSSPYMPTLFRFTGGLSLSPLVISLYLSLFVLLGLLFRGFVYPRWQNRLSTMGLFELSLAIFPFVYLVTPYLSLFSWGHRDTTEGCAEIMKWIALGVIIGGQTLAMTMAVPSAEILLAESAPSDEQAQERVQMVRNMVASLASVVGPVVGGVVYTKGVREGVVGAAWWFYLAVVAIVAAGWCICFQGRVFEEPVDDEKR
ncbi:major facilitator superfamily domain-containing protein [Neurospora intermedia]|uniref:Major facilitator superfamily domain-containing protein n=1 Tax=Neurospora intermedia TaxID=5142 RepID=A0ABR3DAC2_NEUIN